MNVLMIEPGKAPYVTDIGNDLHSMYSMPLRPLLKSARMSSPKQQHKISIRLRAAFSVLSVALSIGEESCRGL